MAVLVANRGTGVLSRSIDDYPEGIIVPVDKPYRWTSADVVRKLKFAAVKHFGQKNLKVGHAGTLDPLATGVLVVCVGKATKLAEEIQAGDKEYVAGITFGATTPSYDLEKPIDRFFPVDGVSEAAVARALEGFVGEQEQVAPLFSAKSVDGVRAYELARKLYKASTAGGGGQGFDGAAESLLNKQIIRIDEVELLSFKEGDFSTSLEMTERELEMTERALERTERELEMTEKTEDCGSWRNRPSITDGRTHSLPSDPTEQPSETVTFSIKVKRGLEGAPALGSLLTHIHTQPPYYSIYESPAGTCYTLDEDPQTGKPAAILATSPDGTAGTLYADASLKPYSVVFQLSTALMIMFTQNGARQNVLLIHASVVELDGRANIFLGKSGTGKSTHSRLWLENIPGAELLNDDNPALGFGPDGRLLVHGTPWSGKTPCYRNVCAPVNAIVRLEQAPHNSISPENGLVAYATLLGAVSAIRWDRSVMDAITRTVEKAIGAVKVFHLDCLPDAAAASLCAEAGGFSL